MTSAVKPGTGQGGNWVRDGEAEVQPVGQLMTFARTSHQILIKQLCLMCLLRLEGLRSFSLRANPEQSARARRRSFKANRFAMKRFLTSRSQVVRNAG